MNELQQKSLGYRIGATIKHLETIKGSVNITIEYYPDGYIKRIDFS